VTRWLAFGYALLVLAWVFAEAPGAGPDEPANYIKAIAVGHGELLGRPGPLPYEEALAFGLTAPRYEWANSTTRWVSISPGLAPVGFGCNAFKAAESAGCVLRQGPRPTGAEQPTYVGTYEPFAYLLPGLLARFADTAAAAMLVMRLTIALICIALLIGAIWLLTNGARGGVPLIGLLVAVTPAFVWLMSIVNASGPEVCAGLCFFAGLLRLARPSEVGRAVWIALGASGLVLSVSRPLGVIWLAIDLGLIVLIANPVDLWQRFRRGLPISGAMATVVGAAALTGVAWELAIDPHHHTTFAEVVNSLSFSLIRLPGNLAEGIGVFGWLETSMPAAAYWLWLSCLAGLILGAWLVGTPRQRRILVLLAILTVVVTLAVGAAILGPTGFVVQGRYVMALAVTLPLYAGEVIYLSWIRLPRVRWRYLLGGLGLLMAALQFTGWLVNAHRQAVGSSGLLTFWLRSDWAPPLGWELWIVLAGVGSLTLTGAVIALARMGASTRPGQTLKAVA